jgi:hypothetical protein
MIFVIGASVLDVVAGAGERSPLKQRTSGPLLPVDAGVPAHHAAQAVADSGRPSDGGSL